MDIREFVQIVPGEGVRQGVSRRRLVCQEDVDLPGAEQVSNVIRHVTFLMPFGRVVSRQSRPLACGAFHPVGSWTQLSDPNASEPSARS